MVAVCAPAAAAPSRASERGRWRGQRGERAQTIAFSYRIQRRSSGLDSPPPAAEQLFFAFSAGPPRGRISPPAGRVPAHPSRRDATHLPRPRPSRRRVAAFSIEWIPVDVTTLLLLCVLVLSRHPDRRGGLLRLLERHHHHPRLDLRPLGSADEGGRDGPSGGGDPPHRGGSRTKVLLCVLPVTTFVSSFMNNTTTTAVLMPAVLGVCRRSRVSPGKVLIPLAYASMLGGTCTLIGTSTNVAASGYMKTAGLAPSRCSSSCRWAGRWRWRASSTWSSSGHRLLPQTRGPAYEEAYSMREYLSEVVVTPGSPLAGTALRDSPLADQGVQVRAVLAGARMDAVPHDEPRGRGPPARPGRPRGAAPGQGDRRDRDPRPTSAGRRGRGGGRHRTIAEALLMPHLLPDRPHPQGSSTSAAASTSP